MKCFILLSVLLLANICVAQNTQDKDNKKFTFSYDYGFNGISSFPLGDFGKTDQSKLPMSRLTKQDTTKLNGYAQKGFHYDFYIAYKLMRYLSVMVFAGGDQNNYDISTLNSQYDKFFPPGAVAVTTGDNYYTVQYLGGPYINKPLYKDFSIELKILAGLTTANYPGLTYIGLGGTTIYTFRDGSGFGYNVGTGIKYMAAKGPIALGVHLNISYAGSNIKYPGYSVTTYTSSGNLLASSAYSVPKSMALGILQLTLGVSLEL